MNYNTSGVLYKSYANNLGGWNEGSFSADRNWLYYTFYNITKYNFVTLPDTSVLGKWIYQH